MWQHCIYSANSALWGTRRSSVNGIQFANWPVEAKLASSSGHCLKRLQRLAFPLDKLEILTHRK